MPKAYTPKTRPEQSEVREQFRLSDHLGTTLAITVQSVEEVNTKYGMKDAIKADVTIVDGILATTDHHDVLLFNAAVVDALRDSVGDEDPIIVRVTSVTGKSGNDYITVSAPTAEAYAAAEALYVKKQSHAGAFNPNADAEGVVPF